jgi:hypothetical protein
MASEPICDEPKQRAGSSDDNLGTLIVLSLLFFAIFFYFGFNNGRKYLSKAENIKEFVSSRTRLLHSGDTNLLVYGRSNHDVCTLDVKSNSVRLGGSMHQLAISESKKPKTISGDSSFLRMFLGGGTRVFTLTELVTIVKQGGNYRQVIVRIVGAGTCYSAGYLISDRLFPPKYDDPAIINWLSHISDSDYSEIKRRSLINLLDKWEQTAKKSAQQIIDSDSDEKLRALKERLYEAKYIPSNEDFSVFAELVSAPNQSQ